MPDPASLLVLALLPSCNEKQNKLHHLLQSYQNSLPEKIKATSSLK